MLGQRDIDLNHDWGEHQLSPQEKEIAINFIHSNHQTFQPHHVLK